MSVDIMIVVFHVKHVCCWLWHSGFTHLCWSVRIDWMQL